MTYRTVLTSKGTTTVPKEIRDRLGIKPGMYVTFSQDPASGNYVIKRSQTIAEVRSMNKAALERAGTFDKPYTSGAGYEAHVAGKHRRHD